MSKFLSRYKILIIPCVFIHDLPESFYRISISTVRWYIIRAIRLGFLSEAVPHQYKTVNGESIIDFFEKIKAQ
jgi:hypothetical protein